MDGAKCKALGDSVRFHYSDGHTPGLMLAEIVGPDRVNGDAHGGVAVATAAFAIAQGTPPATGCGGSSRPRS